MRTLWRVEERNGATWGFITNEDSVVVEIAPYGRKRFMGKNTADFFYKLRNQGAEIIRLGNADMQPIVTKKYW